VLLDGFGSINGHLVLGGISVLNAEVVVFDGDIEEGEDEFVLDGLPDDSCHLVAVHLHHGTGHLYLVLMHQKYTYVSIAQFHKVKLKTTYHLTTKVKQTESSVHNLICTISISTLN